MFSTPRVPPIPCVCSTRLQPRDTDVALSPPRPAHLPPSKGSTRSPWPVLSQRTQEGAPLSGRPHSGGAPQGARRLAVTSRHFRGLSQAPWLTRCPSSQDPGPAHPISEDPAPCRRRGSLCGDRSRLRSQAASGSSHLEAPAPPNENHSDHSKQSTHRVHTKSHHPKCRVIITSSHPHKRVCELVVHPFTDEETEAQS